MGTAVERKSIPTIPLGKGDIHTVPRQRIKAKFRGIKGNRAD